MKKAALVAIFPLLISTQLSTTAYAQNLVALCNLYQMRGSAPGDVIRIPAPADAPQLASGGGMVEIHKDGKVLSNGQDITSATTSACASAPKPGAEEAGMHGDTASGDTPPVKHVVHHKHKAAPKPTAAADTSTSNTDITATPSTESTSGALGQLPANNANASSAGATPSTPPSAPTGTGAAAPAAAGQPGYVGMLAPKAPSSTNSNTGIGAVTPAQTVPTAPPGATQVAPGTPSPSPDQHQEKTTPGAPAQ